MSTDVHININITINKGAVILIFFSKTQMA